MEVRGTGIGGAGVERSGRFVRTGRPGVDCSDWRRGLAGSNWQGERLLSIWQDGYESAVRAGVGSAGLFCRNVCCFSRLGDIGWSLA